jgi:transcriptional regulator with XRE-family HTH domain
MSDRKTSNLPAIARVLRTWRRRRKLTQQELAAKAGLKPVTLRAFERGEITPDEDDRQRICAALDVVPGDFDQEVFWIEKREGFAGEASAPEKLTVESVSASWDVVFSYLKPLFLKLIEWGLRDEETPARPKGRKP